VYEQDKRRYPRLKHRAKIKVIQPGPPPFFFADMRDFSETGLFLLCTAELIPEMDAIIEVQTTEFEDAPIRQTKVIRTEPGVGFGVTFI